MFVNKLFKLFILFFLAGVAGCVTTKISESGYYWGEYSQTYYAYLENPSKETESEHLASLLDIINISKEKGLKYPPGIYAEIGYFKQKKGKTKEANAYFTQELQYYPEAQPFIEKLFVKVN